MPAKSDTAWVGTSYSRTLYALMEKNKRWLAGSSALAYTMPMEAEVPTPADTALVPPPARVETVHGAETGVGVCVCVGVGVDVTDAAMVEELLGVGDLVGVLERDDPLLGVIVADKLKIAGQVSWRRR